MSSVADEVSEVQPRCGRAPPLDESLVGSKHKCRTIFTIVLALIFSTVKSCSADFVDGITSNSFCADEVQTNESRLNAKIASFSSNLREKSLSKHKVNHCDAINL